MKKVTMILLLAAVCLVAVEVASDSTQDSVQVVYTAEYVHLLYGHVAAAQNMLTALARSDELTLEQLKVVRALLDDYEATLERVADYSMIIEIVPDTAVEVEDEASDND